MTIPDAAQLSRSIGHAMAMVAEANEAAAATLEAIVRPPIIPGGLPR